MRSAETLTRFITVFVILLGWSMGRPQELRAQEVCTSTQVTNSDTSSIDPFISADGTRIVFRSRADLTGKNSDGNWMVFLYDTITSSLPPICSPN